VIYPEQEEEKQRESDLAQQPEAWKSEELSLDGPESELIPFEKEEAEQTYVKCDPTHDSDDSDQDAS